MSEVSPDESLALAATLMSESSRRAIAELASITTPAVELSASVRAALETVKPNLKALDVMGDALRHMSQVGNLSPVMESLTSANMHYSDLMKEIALPDHLFADALLAQSRLAETVERLSLSSSVAAELAQIDMGRFVSASMAAQSTLSRMEFSAVGSLLDATRTFNAATIADLTRLTFSYDQLVRATTENTRLISSFPAVASLPAVDYYRQVELLESVTVPEEEALDFEVVELSLTDSVPSVDALLAEMDTSLVPMLNGARAAVGSANPDRERHVIISLRELVGAVIHALAPDESVRHWTDDANHYHNGRPTRRARILYACRDLESSPLERFLDDDVTAALSFIDFLNSETHVRQSSLATRHLSAAVARAESLLLFLLQLPQR